MRLKVTKKLPCLHIPNLNAKYFKRNWKPPSHRRTAHQRFRVWGKGCWVWSWSVRAHRTYGKGNSKKWEGKASRGSRMPSHLWRTLPKKKASGRHPHSSSFTWCGHPRKLVGNSFNTVFTPRGTQAAASSILKQYVMGRPSASTAPKSLSEVKQKSELNWHYFCFRRCKCQS